MELWLGVVEWEDDASNVRCTNDVWRRGAKAPVVRSFYSVVDLGKAYSSVGVVIVRKYLVNEKGSCNGCDQAASLTPHRASDLSDTSVPLARQVDSPSSVGRSPAAVLTQVTQHHTTLPSAPPHPYFEHLKGPPCSPAQATWEDGLL